MFTGQAIITGAGAGIGRSAAVLLATEGAQLTLVDLDEQGLAGTRDEIQKAAPEPPSCLSQPTSPGRRKSSPMSGRRWRRPGTSTGSSTIPASRASAASPRTAAAPFLSGREFRLALNAATGSPLAKLECAYVDRATDSLSEWSGRHRQPHRCSQCAERCVEFVH